MSTQQQTSATTKPKAKIRSKPTIELNVSFTFDDVGMTWGHGDTDTLYVGDLEDAVEQYSAYELEDAREDVSEDDFYHEGYQLKPKWGCNCPEWIECLYERTEGTRLLENGNFLAADADDYKEACQMIQATLMDLLLGR
jgi:hypothetical protein